jgi:guanosine-3',5'-bis(diphosphate) 3'-pyrophosphohydrolase
MPGTLKDEHASLLEAVLEAAAFAARAHRGQHRKDGETPYVSHVFRVCLILDNVFGIRDRQILMTALLHDTVEDTTTDFDDLEAKFGAPVAEWVACLSKDKRLPEAEREKDYMKRLAKAPWQVRVCKLADMFDNLMDLKQLSAGKRARAFERLSSYLECLRKLPAHDRLRRPLELVGQLLEENRP